MKRWISTGMVAVGMSLAVTACGGGGGGGDYSPAAPSQNTGTGGSGGSGGSSSSTPAAATITISSAGVSPRSLSIEAGQKVTFVNQDSRPHEIGSDPHPVHTDCPPTNTIGLLQPGASKTTSDYGTMRACGFHDHLDPDNAAWRGTILVGTTGTPDPGYVR
ncbi:MAG: hypothetical protein AB1806_08680 [Acidobacteriota bacterium]